MTAFQNYYSVALARARRSQPCLSPIGISPAGTGSD